MPTLEELRARYKSQSQPGPKKKKRLIKDEAEPESLSNQLDVEEVAAERAKHQRKKRKQMEDYLEKKDSDRKGLIDWGHIKGKVIFKFSPKPDILFKFGGKKDHHLSGIDDEKYLRWLIKDLKLTTFDNKLFHKLVTDRVKELETGMSYI